jgi:hypothetical protein
MTEDTTDSVASPLPSRHVSVWIAASFDEVHDFASDPAKLPQWAAGLSDPVIADSTVVFVPFNQLGVLDHVVRLPSGEQVYNPMRVIPNQLGDTHSEVVFTIRRRAGMTNEQFDADAAAVTADLETLRELVERPG